MRALAVCVLGFATAASCTGQDRGPCKFDKEIPDMQSWFARTPAAVGGKYEAAKSRREKVTQGSEKLKLGMSKREVEGTIGPPDFESVYSTFDAHVGNRPVSNPHCGWEWEYYFSKVGENFGDPSDCSLHLAFNSQEKLIWVKPQNLKGLKEKGSPELS